MERGFRKKAEGRRKGVEEETEEEKEREAIVKEWRVERECGVCYSRVEE